MEVSLRLLLDPTIGLEKYLSALDAAIDGWDREKYGGVKPWGELTVGFKRLPPLPTDLCERRQMFVEFVGPIHGDNLPLISPPENGRNLMLKLVLRAEREFAARELPQAREALITVGFCIWRRDSKGMVTYVSRLAA